MSKSTRTILGSLTLGAVLASLAISPVAQALPVTGSTSLDFTAGKQSLWGPGGVATSFRTQGSVGTDNLGFNWDIGASSGTVESAKFNGRLAYGYEDNVDVANADRVSFNFVGDANGGLFSTLFGAGIETNWQLLGLEGCIYCKGAKLDAGKTFTPKLDTQVVGTDRASVAGVEVGPNVLVASGTAGVDVDLSQRSTFEATGITGDLTATNRTSGRSKALGFDVLDNGLANIDLGLDEVGHWDIALTGLTLRNRFWSSFSATLVPFVQYTIGPFCGDAGTDNDNGFGCVGDERADFDIATLSLGATDQFALNFDRLNLNPFSINVLGSRSVPEPALLGLLALGLVLMRVRRA